MARKISTANMDMWCFHLNFEVNALLVHTESVSKLVADFEHDIESTLLYDRHPTRNKRIMTRLLESAAHLMFPLL